MPEKNNAKCDICGKEYYVCRSCSEVTKFKPWRTVTDTFEHYIIFMILSNYHSNGDIEKARKSLSQCNLSNLDSFNENVKVLIDKILKEDRNEKQSEEDTAVKMKPVARKTKKEKNIEQ